MNLRNCLWLSLLCILCMLLSCKDSNRSSLADQKAGVAIAFIADVHFQDIYAEVNDSKAGSENRSQVIRTMESQLTSTRLFNENYFALIAALDDVVDRGIRLVALPGDYSDEGQPVNITGLINILKRYEDDHGLQFFISPGNHDPNGPFDREAGKRDYLGRNGQPQPIFSTNHPICTNDSNQVNSRSNQSITRQNEVICSDEVKELGYESLFELLSDYGLMPNERTIYFETPFSNYNLDEYQFNRAYIDAEAINRQFEICTEGTGGEYRELHYTNCHDMMDFSYLIEPIDGLWLLSIDANVYQPIGVRNPGLSPSGENVRFSSSGNAGYNMVLTHKQHLPAWISEVVKRAEANNKTLLAFSHFPIVDFYDDAQDKIEHLWGEGNFQLNRMPFDDTSKAFAATGLKIHVGGHMHMNDTGIVYDDASGNTLVNIQTPSLAGYVPAYKIIRYQEGSDVVEVETVVLEDVPNFNAMFSSYSQEWQYLDSDGDNSIWNRDILESADYYEFTDWHLQELSRLRFLPQEWPEDIRHLLTVLNGRDMLISSQLESNISFSEFKNWTEDGSLDLANIDFRFAEKWRNAEEKAMNIANRAGINLEDMQDWNGTDLSVDFYRLRNADELAFRDITSDRMQQYSLILESLKQTEFDPSDESRYASIFKQKFIIIFEIMNLFSNSLPSNHFLIDMKTGNITNKKGA